jgi:hypothetical protein
MLWPFYLWGNNLEFPLGKRETYKILVGKPELKRLLRTPRCRWKDNIKMDFRETGFGVWIGFI